MVWLTQARKNYDPVDRDVRFFQDDLEMMEAVRAKFGHSKNETKIGVLCSDQYWNSWRGEKYGLQDVSHISPKFIRAIRSRLDPELIIIPEQEHSCLKHVREILHEHQFKGSLYLIGSDTVSLQPSAFGDGTPVVSYDFPFAGKNRFRPAFLHLFKKVQSKFPPLEPYIRRLKYINDMDGNYKHWEVLQKENTDFMISHCLRMNYNNVSTMHDPMDLSRLGDLNIRFIVLVRDPRDIINSFHFKTMPELSLGHQEAIDLCLDGYTRVSDDLDYVMGWPDIKFMMESFLFAMKSPNMHVVKFEDLNANEIPTLRKMLAFAGIDNNPLAPIKTADLLDAANYCTFEYQTGGKRSRGQGSAGWEGNCRKGTSGDWRNNFTEKNVDKFKEMTGELLVELGYEDNMDWSL